MSNAMDRISRLDEEKPIMSLDEQLAAADEITDPENAEFFGGMSPAAKEAMSNSLLKNEVTLEDMEEQFSNEEAKSKEEDVSEPVVKEKVEESVVEEPISKATDEEQFNNNTESHKQRGRPAKAKVAEAAPASVNTYDPIMEQLAKDLLSDLRKQKYAYGNFSAAHTKLILDYIYNKI